MYDGDGKRVEQLYVVFTDGEITGTLTTSYFSGGAYEVRTDGATSATLKYYSFAGMSIAMKDSSGLKYLLTDQLGSVVAVTNASGNLLDEQRYLPYGQVRTDVDSITQTDLGYTGQRDLDVEGNSFPLGLMDYNARFYDSYLNPTFRTSIEQLVTILHLRSEQANDLQVVWSQALLE